MSERRTEHRIPPDTSTVKDRLKEFWNRIRDEKVGDLVDKAKFWVEAVGYGADPIEAASGHLCGPKCMHWETMSEEQRELLRKAPWNQG